MALNTLAAVKTGLLPSRPWMKTAGSVANWQGYSSPLLLAGQPGAWTPPTPGVAGQVMTGPVSGFLSLPNPVSGETKLARATARNTNSLVGCLVLCDMLWCNSGLSATLTTSQTVNSVALPARDHAESTNGDNVQAGLLVTSLMGAGTPTATLGYTNSGGTAGRTGLNIPAIITTLSAGMIVPFGMNAGDQGVRSIQSLQLSATMTSGAFSLIMYRELALLPAPPTTGDPGNAEVVDDIFTLTAAKIPNDHCLFVMARHAGNAQTAANTNFTFSQG